ncbi:hypothetical protein EON80_05515 [bacterium]|nr:MAG: hypothetical protein EON80_05515 [bacterium]
MPIPRLAVRIFVAAFVLNGGQAWGQPPGDKGGTPATPRPIADTGGHVLGNPARAIEQLKQIYPLLQRYAVRHNGQHPTKSTALVQELIKAPKEYGFASYEEARSLFINPDSMYAGVRDPDSYFAYSIATQRPDGSPLGGPRLAGTRDVWALTDIYQHTNGGGQAANPVGFYLVLWEDGEVEKIPYDLVLSFPRDQVLRRPAFMGQSGVPADAIRYNESFPRFPVRIVKPAVKPVARGNKSPVDDNGGPEALVELSRAAHFSDRNGIEREKLWETFDLAQPEFSLEQIREGAAKLGFDVSLSPSTLAELQERATPALVQLRDGNRIVLLSALDADEAFLIDRGIARQISRREFEEQYLGAALVAGKSSMGQASIVAEDAVRSVDFTSRQEEVWQRVTIKNRGAQPVSIQLHHPLLGVTEAKLSANELAPGASATLDLKLKWRSTLPGTIQETLVNIGTSDPLLPQLSLGFQLRLDEAETV